jgi:hypothetical protein
MLDLNNEERNQMRPTTIAVGIVAVTALALGGVHLREASTGASVSEQKRLTEEQRSHYLRLTAQEIISNGDQYPSYDIDGDIGQTVPSLNGSRLSSFRSSKTGLYYAIGKLNGVQTILFIFSRTEVQTSIDLEMKAQKGN